ncbi:MAG: porin family protein [Muribaculaceae bacterium]
MKKLLITAIAAAMLAVAPCANAETHYKPHISVGGHAGMSMSQMSFSPSISQKWANGLTMGIQARYAEEKIFGLIGELNIVQRGWAESFDEHPELQYSRSLTYVSIPLMTHIYFGPRRFKFFVNLGPEFSYMVSDNISSNFDYRNPQAAGIPASRHCEQMSMDIHSRFDYGITAGLGAEYYIRPRHSVYIEARFYYGLGNIYPSSKADTFSASRSMNLAITAGYNFRLK